MYLTWQVIVHFAVDAVAAISLTYHIYVGNFLACVASAVFTQNSSDLSSSILEFYSVVTSRTVLSDPYYPPIRANLLRSVQCASISTPTSSAVDMAGPIQIPGSSNASSELRGMRWKRRARCAYIRGVYSDTRFLGCVRCVVGKIRRGKAWARKGRVEVQGRYEQNLLVDRYQK